MKTVLFCQNPYAFGILEPIMMVLKEKKFEYLWFVKGSLKEKFPFKNEPFTSVVKEVMAFNSDAIFVPGNEVPYYLRGVKVQVFHGLAGEKKGHFRIRHYFDLYLTQGPYFTKKFIELKNKFQNFDVVETGWPKLDIYGKELHKYDVVKRKLLEEHNAKKIVLYAPTFSPSLTSAQFLIDEFNDLAKNKEYLILIKFHDLMATDLINIYNKLAKDTTNIIIEEERNIIKFLLMADIMISDTSSVVYEFLLLDKPVITYKCSSRAIQWDNSNEYENLAEKVKSNLQEDKFREERMNIVQEYHPYNDGKSALRMVEAVSTYISKNGVPSKRKLSFLRRLKIHKIFGKL
ncbi:MAG: CDP-glycerol--glycerophosphate glycerophosphotransferase [Lutibacter sp.]|uniref:CDP-glycerol glycerophosphotransferase family protein n=1 Tax=Lutibacter sp. TaxID=1925666 RepID=UPI0017FCD647|nr:CDP-glycerol glycerophosphotransferase family protein [Lutibacter sp.]MBT8316878.1 CDP-glycerol glycerophosphotransferase family protein [Lutibacter sp.]NNJ57738.1 CDP-glycerol--glycerophosphate glycerophosphotransferase [Lutibacter sp.]